jgi:ComF family protein
MTLTLRERASRVALDLLFPPECALCTAPGALICCSCLQALPAAGGRRCARCWMPMGAGAASASVCRHCGDAPPAFTSLRAAFTMEGGARRLVHLLKYDALTSLAGPMAPAMAAAATAPVDVVVPVPLHRGRQRARGYNQAALLARGIARAAGVPADASAARRTRATAPLVKAMSREERRAIVRGAFAANPARVDGLRVLLVDDVATTGATLDACATALLHSGAREVHCLTWARAD